MFSRSNTTRSLLILTAAFFIFSSALSAETVRKPEIPAVEAAEIRNERKENQQFLHSSSQEEKLLKTGKEAFPEIISCIRNAKNSIYINMFIWRDDNIGNTIAAELLKAADRGVKVEISADLYGSICEHAEESGASFFHKSMTLTEKIKVLALEVMYKNENLKQKDSESQLYVSIMNHPNITVEKDTFKADHSKFWIFDDEILILGGINVEDKENGSDLHGREYEDYMIKLTGREYVDFLKKVRSLAEYPSVEERQQQDFYYGVNIKGKNRKENRFEMEDLYVDLINGSQEKLVIIMAYFTPIKDIVNAIEAACNRGVEVTLILPENANFQNDSNRKTAKKLLKDCPELNLYFSPKMLHTKMLITEKELTFGSCNITKKSFHQLDELNVFIKNCSTYSALFEEILNDAEETQADSEKINLSREIKYSILIAFMEGLLV